MKKHKVTGVCKCCGKPIGANQKADLITCDECDEVGKGLVLRLSLSLAREAPHESAVLARIGNVEVAS